MKKKERSLQFTVTVSPAARAIAITIRVIEQIVSTSDQQHALRTIAAYFGYTVSRF